MLGKLFKTCLTFALLFLVSPARSLHHATLYLRLLSALLNKHVHIAILRLNRLLYRLKQTLVSKKTAHSIALHQRLLLRYMLTQI